MGQSAATGLLMGFIGTLLIMDVWGLLLQRIFGIAAPRPNRSLVLAFE
ncbi:MAG: hypothetical protein QMB16_03890 [Paracoccaceae bacterium]|jgi:hypothetical protein